MILAWIIFIVYTAFALYDLKKAILVWMPVQLLFNVQVALRYASPALYLNLSVTMVLFLLYLVKGRRSKAFNNENFLFKPILILNLISYAFSLMFSIVGLSVVLMETIRTFLNSFSFIYMFQKTLCTKSDIRLVYKSCIAVVFIICLLGLYESVVGDNPWLDYVYDHSSQEYRRMYYMPGNVWRRYGMVRAYSVFYIHIAFGTTCVFLLFAIGTAYSQKWLSKEQKVLLISILLLVAGVFMSNSKTGLFGLVVMFFALVKFKDFFKVQYILPLGVIVVGIFVLFPEYLSNFTSLFDEDAAEEGSGSTVDMRMTQFAVAIRLFHQNPLFGNGLGSISAMMNIGDNADILGSESSWMKILPERGILGAIVYIMSFFYMYKNFKDYIPKWQLISFLGSLLVMETATGFMDMSLYGSVLILVRKAYMLNKKCSMSKRVASDVSYR